MAGTAFEGPLARISAALEGGKPSHMAVAGEPELFSQSVAVLLRAAEEGGPIPAVASRLVEAVQDGSLPLPGVPPKGDEQVRFWRCFGHMIGSGVPILETFRVLRKEVCTDALADAVEAIEQSVLRGSSMASVMREHTDLFPLAVCFAVEIGEDSGNLHEQAMRIANALESGDLRSLRAEPIEALPQMHELPAVSRFVNVLMLNALQERASDVHVEPTENGQGRFRLRLDGVLHDYSRPREGLRPGEQIPYDEVVNRIKVMAGMDLMEKRAPQDGRIQLNVSGRAIDVRVSSVPMVRGERVVMRMLDRRTMHPRLREIGLLDEDLATARSLCRLPHGLVLVAGPTGSGKTTLLYAMLMELDRDSRCVVSVEDPVEYYLEGVSQVDVDPRAGRTFPAVVRSLLRQDPDVIMIGMLPDAEVANLAAQCALNGHLVFSTIDAPTASAGLRRLLDMGLEPFVLNSSLAAVISQRLVRMLCRECREPIDPPRHSLPPDAAEMLEGRENVQFYRPAGCEKCRGTGYRGRTCIHEILTPDHRIRELIAGEAPAREIRQAATAAGMRTMLQCGILRAADGTTSVEEVLRVMAADLWE